MAATDHLERGREAYARRAWRDAFESLAVATAADDLERLATAAYMLGRDDDYVAALERAHQAYLDGGEALRAVRCAFWIGMNLVLRREVGARDGMAGPRTAAAGARGARLRRARLPAAPADVPARGGRRPRGRDRRRRRGRGDRRALRRRRPVRARRTGQGILLIGHGRVAEGLRLLDEAMVAVTAGELSPIVNGFVYCGVITGCQAATSRAAPRSGRRRSTRWCEQQPDMVELHRRLPRPSSRDHAAPRRLGRRRSQEARRAGERCAAGGERARGGRGASTARARSHRLRRASSRRPRRPTGRRAAAGASRSRAWRCCGWPRGRRDAAAAAIRRALAERASRRRAPRLLPASSRSCSRSATSRRRAAPAAELEEIAAAGRARLLDAIVAHARGAVELARGRRRRGAGGAAPCVPGVARAGGAVRGGAGAGAARTACRALGDDDTASLELEAARAVFAQLGAAPDLAGSTPRPRARPPRAHAARARGPPPRRRRQEQPGDLRRARDQRAHRGPASAEHLRQARRVVAHRRERVRVRARAASDRRMVRNDHAPRRAKLVNPGDARGRAAP